MRIGKGNWDRQRKEAAKILSGLDSFSASNGRVDVVARALREEGREAAEMKALEVYKDPYYAI